MKWLRTEWEGRSHRHSWTKSDLSARQRKTSLRNWTALLQLQHMSRSCRRSCSSDHISWMHLSGSTHRLDHIRLLILQREKKFIRKSSMNWFEHIAYLKLDLWISLLTIQSNLATEIEGLPWSGSTSWLRRDILRFLRSFLLGMLMSNIPITMWIDQQRAKVLNISGTYIS